MPPRTSIPLRVDGLLLDVVGDGDGQRFARAFASAWRAIPRLWRQRLLEHWRRPRRTQPAATGPTISLVPRSIDSRRVRGRRRSDFAVGWISYDADRISFWASAVDAMPLRLVEGVVAHELAHAVQLVDGGSDASTEAGEEREANWIARAWGFEVDEVDDWLDQNLRRISEPNLMRRRRKVIPQRKKGGA